MAKPIPQTGDRARRNVHNILRGAYNGDVREVELALKDDPKAIVEQETLTGLTAIHIAAAQGDLQMTSWLLKQDGVDLTIKDTFGRDPMHIALELGDDDVYDVLSERLHPKSFEL